jgi:hypothetical protein
MQQLPDPFWLLQILQLVFTQIPKCQLGGKGFAHQVCGQPLRAGP